MVIPERSHIERNIEEGWLKRLSGVSSSVICPASITHIRSYPMIVLNEVSL